VLLTAFARLYSALAGGVLLFLSARILGPSNHGVFSAAISWASIIAQLVCLSFPQVLPFYLQRSGSARTMPGRALIRWAFVQSCIGAIIFALIAASGLVFGLAAAPVVVCVLFALFIPALLFDEYARALCTNSELLNVYNRSLVLGKTIAILVVLFLLLFDRASLMGFAFAYFLSFLMPVFLIFVGAGSRLQNLRGEESPFRFFVDNGLRLYPNTLGSQVLANNGAIVGSLFLSAKEIGWYQLGMQVVNLLLLLPQAFASVMFGRMATSTPDAIWQQQKRYIPLVLLPVAIFAIVGYKYGDSVITRLFGPSWGEGASVVIGVLPVAISMAFAQAMTPQWLGRGHFTATSVVTCLVAISNLLLSFLLIPALGAHALVISAWICLGGITFLFQSVFFWRCNSSVPSAVR